MRSPFVFARCKKTVGTLALVSFLSLTLGGCDGADTDTSAPVPVSEQSKKADEQMKNFMMTKGANKAKAK